ncbi:MAG: Lipase 3 [Saprospiraceae bacterium]|nr:Lipase 3 [Saprospiraceae bacterium]
MKHTLLSNGLRIAYRSDGVAGGLPLVLLHGFCEDSAVWNDFIVPIKSLHIIRVDLPGFGGSDLPLVPGMDVYADAVCAVLNDLSVEKCVLVGHSMGGYAALEFAEKYPERLSGLGLFHSHPFEDTAERKDARRRGIEMLQSGKRDLYVAQLFPGLFAGAFAKANPPIIAAQIAKGKRQSAEAIIAALEGMITRKDHRETLRNAACPVLFLLGTEDSIIPPEQGLQAAVLPDLADVHLLPGVGHMGMFEATERCAEIVRRFWEFCANR